MQQSKIELRPYQDESVLDLRTGFKTALRQVLCLPTGAGKTVVFSEIVKLAALRGTRCLVVTDRIELFKQTFKALSKVGVEPQIINADKRDEVDPWAVVSVAMVETVKRRIVSRKIRLYPELIIIDEAHKRNFDAILDMFPDARVIGATATPIGQHFYKYYDSIVANVDIPELIENGFLVPCEAYQMEEDLSDLKTRAGEYTPNSLNDHYNKKGLFDGVIKSYLEKAAGLKTLVFNVSIEHTINMNNAFLQAGIHAEYITSKTPKAEREDILKRFTEGRFTVLNNCGILTTGYDEPSIECIILNRATKSLPLFLQCAGRGSRLYPNKERFILLDFGLNHNQHGLWSQPRKWALEPPKKKKEAAGVAPVKECPACEALIFASAMSCNFCGYEYPVEAKPLREGVLVEVLSGEIRDLAGKRVSELSLEELGNLQRSKRYSHYYVWRVVKSRGEEAIRDYARLMSYSVGWVIRQKEDLENCHFADVHI